MKARTLMIRCEEETHWDGSAWRITDLWLGTWPFAPWCIVGEINLPIWALFPENDN